MILPGSRTAGLFATAAAAAALAVAIAAERLGGLAPCPLCLMERWPYRVVIILGLFAAAVPVAPGAGSLVSHWSRRSPPRRSQ